MTILRFLLQNSFRIIFVLFLSNACSDPQREEYDIYSFQRGWALYDKNCQSCHGKKGEGFEGIYPPLNTSYLAKIKSDIPCIIANGMNDTITINGKVYNQRMLGFSDLKSYEIADLSTFILNAWDNQYGGLEENKVIELLKKCKN